jgi:thiol-disulfide isomerase/thioredoxin
MPPPPPRFLRLDTDADLRAHFDALEHRILGHQKVVLLAHATWCGHCVAFLPVWKRLLPRLMRAAGSGVAVVQVESAVLDRVRAAHPDSLFAKFIAATVSYFPTLATVDGRRPARLYDGPRTEADVLGFLEPFVRGPGGGSGSGPTPKPKSKSPKPSPFASRRRRASGAAPARRRPFSKTP